MAVRHITEAELERNVSATLESVSCGDEFVVERNHQPLAVIQRARTGGRMISDVIADLEARESQAVMDDDFARDIELGIGVQRQPWHPPSWD